MHIVVIDEDGEITGVPGTILETYEGLSKLSDAKADEVQTTIVMFSTISPNTFTT